MKLRESFIIHEADGESMLISTGTASFSGVVRGNKTLGLYLNMLQNGTTREEMICSACGKFIATRDAVEKDIDKLLAELRRIGAIDG